MVSIRKRYCFVGLLILLTIYCLFWMFVQNRPEQPYIDPFITVRYLPDYDLEENSSKSNRLINLNDFAYLLKPSVCEGELAILIVTSYVGHDEVRAAHRMAFSQQYLQSIRMQRVFLLARIPVHDKYIRQKSIENENNRFDDLLQGNFDEAYRNLTYKHVMGLRWAATECKATKFIVKIDDDTVFDLFHLNRYLKELAHDAAYQEKFIAGYILDNKPPIRTTANKWYVTQMEYPGTVYPDYVSGWLYITTRPAAHQLIVEAQHQPFFWIDDTWITGILRHEQNISLRRLNAWFSSNPEFLECCIRDVRKSSLKCDYFVGPNGGDSKLIVEYTRALAQCYIEHSRCYQRSAAQFLNHTCVGTWKNLIGQQHHGDAFVSAVRL